jgi:ssDNA-binding replication factor A large subunit
VKISEISPGDENLSFVAKVLSFLTKVVNTTGKSGNKVRCLLGDETGTVKAFLYENSELVIGKSVYIWGAEAKVEKEHI